MFEKQEKKKLPDDDTKQESLLFRLWSRSRPKEGERPEPPSPPADEPKIPDEIPLEPAPPAAAVPENSLLRLWQSYRGGQPPPMMEPDAVRGEREEAQVAQFREELALIAQELVTRGEASPEPEHANIQLKVSDDAMTAWIFIFPPQRGGDDVTDDRILGSMLSAGVVFGFERSLVERIANERLYFRILALARGKEPVHGQNGELIDCIRRESTIETSRNEDGSVGYQNVNAFHNVKKGSVICKIVPPTEGVDGINVRGEKVRARHGRPSDIPRGGSFALSPDGTELIAAVDGQVSFKNNKFILEKLLVIDGDVDLSVGNLDFEGDVVISGDVRDGYQVKASGNVTIRGMVEDASVVAGGDITLEKGMNGNGSGTLDAQGEIRSKFLENCVVRSTGSIYAGSIIWCTVLCDDSVHVTTEKGVIIGGTCTACNLVEAHGIGSRSNRLTTVVIGNTPNMIERRDQFEEEAEQLRVEYAEVIKDISYLETRPGGMTADRKILLNKLRLKKPVLLMKESRLQKQLEELGANMADVSHGRILCGTLYPFTRIVFGETSMTIEEVYRQCLIRYTGGEITIGMY